MEHRLKTKSLFVILMEEKLEEATKLIHSLENARTDVLELELSENKEHVEKLTKIINDAESLKNEIRDLKILVR